MVLLGLLIIVVIIIISDIHVGWRDQAEWAHIESGSKPVLDIVLKMIHRAFRNGKSHVKITFHYKIRLIYDKTISYKRNCIQCISRNPNFQHPNHSVWLGHIFVIMYQLCNQVKWGINGYIYRVIMIKLTYNCYHNA